MIARITLVGEHAANDPIVEARLHRAVVIEPHGAAEPMLEPETVRRFPRTLHGSDGAFTRDPDYSAPIEVSAPLPRSFWFLIGFLIGLAIGAAL